jgi:ATP-dependent Clp protease ATP-binding subunit ClpC
MNRIRHVEGLEPYLRERVIGQEDAVARVSRALEGAELGLNETGGRPRAAFLFMGPTGVGKTSCCKAFTECLFGESSLAMIFCNELQSADDVPELVRSVRQAVEKHPQGATLLFDEVEKMHRSLIDVLLSLLDEGQVTEPGGNRVSVAGCYVVLTSNIGAARWGQMEQTLYSTMQAFAYREARKALRPELFARLTETIVFRPLSQTTQEAILRGLTERKLLHLTRRFETLLGANLSAPLAIDEKGVNAYLLRKGFTQMDGARGLKAEVDRQFNLAAAPWIFAGKSPVEGRFYAKADRLELR